MPSDKSMDERWSKPPHKIAWQWVLGIPAVCLAVIAVGNWARNISDMQPSVATQGEQIKASLAAQQAFALQLQNAFSEITSLRREVFAETASIRREFAVAIQSLKESIKSDIDNINALSRKDWERNNGTMDQLARSMAEINAGFKNIREERSADSRAVVSYTEKTANAFSEIDRLRGVIEDKESRIRSLEVKAGLGQIK